MNPEEWKWLREGMGQAPRVRWSFCTDAPLLALEFAPETGEILAADQSGGGYRLNRHGRILTVNRGIHLGGTVAWSACGAGGVAGLASDRLTRFDVNLKSLWTVTFPAAVQSVALDARGQYLAVALDSSRTHILGNQQQRIAQIETMHPLDKVQFWNGFPGIVGVSRLGMLSVHHYRGEELWTRTLHSNVGELALSGNGEFLLLAAHTHGIQVYNQRGMPRGMFQVEGTPNRVSCSYFPKIIAAATVEQNLYWMDFSGSMLWAAHSPEPIFRVHCDPLGRFLICGFASGYLVRLDFG